MEGAAEVDPAEAESPAYLRLVLGSHLASYLRLKIEQDFGYTSTCGISTNKLLSKLVGSKNKPRNQTTLLALTNDDNDNDVVVSFMDSHVLRKIPGIGFKIAQALDAHVTKERNDADSHSFDSSVTSKDVRTYPDISPGSLENLLAGPGSERGIGARIWGLLHGVDPTEVKEASDVPSQISIEDTYKGLETLGQIVEELHKLSHSLIRRMRVDLLVNDELVGGQKWLARPKTLRLSIRSWPTGGPASQNNMNYNRISRSGPLPNFVFSIEDDIEQITERLVAEALLPLLRRLQTEKGQRWNLQLINICATNMVMGASENKSGAGRDISVMFKRQDEVLRPWKIAQDDHVAEVEPQVEDDLEAGDSDTSFSWEAADSLACPQCGHLIPPFAVAAHIRFHEYGD